jgi:hypothetical protein
MPKYFPGITHCIVRTPKNKEEMEATQEVIADVALCFGDDSDGLGPIRIKKMQGVISGVSAYPPKALVIENGKKAWLYILNGKVADEAKMTALIAFDKVKQKFGVKYNKKYKVVGDTVEEIGANDAISSSGMGEQPTV